MPSIKEALEFYADPFEWKEKNDPENVVFVPDHYEVSGFGDTAKAALTTFQPDGEKREAVARIMVRNDPNYTTYHMPGDTPRKWYAVSGYVGTTSELSEDHAESIRKRADHILASGLVQDEAGEPTTAMVDAGVAFALNVSLSGEYRWSQYVTDLYKTMRAAAIRSARDGGAS